MSGKCSSLWAVWGWGWCEDAHGQHGSKKNSPDAQSFLGSSSTSLPATRWHRRQICLKCSSLLCRLFADIPFHGEESKCYGLTPKNSVIVLYGFFTYFNDCWCWAAGRRRAASVASENKNEVVILVYSANKHPPRRWTLSTIQEQTISKNGYIHQDTCFWCTRSDVQHYSIGWSGIELVRRKIVYTVYENKLFWISSAKYWNQILEASRWSIVW